MVKIRVETASDVPPREALLNRAFGAARFRKTSEKLRAGRLCAQNLAFAAVDDKGKLIGTLRLWNITAGSAGQALLLGPLAVDQQQQGSGIGAALMRHALAQAKQAGHTAVLLVGDAPYYNRFGFSEHLTHALYLPGPVERQRFLGLELNPSALSGAEGLVSASGAMAGISRKVA